MASIASSRVGACATATVGRSIGSNTAARKSVERPLKSFPKARGESVEGDRKGRGGRMLVGMASPAAGSKYYELRRQRQRLARWLLARHQTRSWLSEATLP